MFISCGQDELYRSPKKAYFSCLIGLYFLSFFYEHPVYSSFEKPVNCSSKTVQIWLVVIRLLEKFPSTSLDTGICLPLSWILMSTGNCLALLPHMNKYTFLMNVINLNVLVFPRILYDWLTVILFLLLITIVDRMKEIMVQKPKNGVASSTKNTLQMYEKVQKSLTQTMLFIIFFA